MEHKRQLPVAAICSHLDASSVQALLSSPFIPSDNTRIAEVVSNEGDESWSRAGVHMKLGWMELMVRENIRGEHPSGGYRRKDVSWGEPHSSSPALPTDLHSHASRVCSRIFPVCSTFTSPQ